MNSNVIRKLSAHPRWVASLYEFVSPSFVHTPAEPTPLTQTPTMNPFLRHDCASHPTNSGSLLFSDVCRGFPYARVVTRIVRSPHPLRGSLPKLFAKSPHIPRNCGLQPLFPQSVHDQTVSL